jgi:hypothetical protein
MSSQVRPSESALQSKPASAVTLGEVAGPEAVAVALNSAVLAVRASEPVVAVVPGQGGGEEALPCTSFFPAEHRSLEGGVRSCVRAQTGVDLRFLEQLCTSGSASEDASPHVVSVSYLALVDPSQCSDRTRASWRSWYSFLPWEDWRTGRPDCLNDIESRLEAWAESSDAAPFGWTRDDRRQRIRVAFGGGGVPWDEEKVAERYQVLCDAGIVGPAMDGASGRRLSRLMHPVLGDQSWVLARAIGELRRAIKYRPLVFELMHEEFTLFELQRTVEAILGPHLHKQNFRRLVEGSGLVEPTGGLRLRTGGRPAQLYRFRRDVIYERAAPGVRLRPGRV